MRTFGSWIDTAVKFREPSIPDRRLERAIPQVTDHLGEGIRELFNYACAAGELDAAADLLSVSRTWHTRCSYPDEQQKRSGNVHLARMEGELKRRHIMKGARA